MKKIINKETIVGNITFFAKTAPAAPPEPVSVSFNVVDSGYNDGFVRRDISAWWPTSTVLSMYGAAYDYEIWTRFTGVTIPSGATIDSAKLRLTSSVNVGGTHEVTIRMEDADDAAILSNYSDMVGRDRTSQSQNWTIPVLSAGVQYDTTDFTSVLQEVIDRPGWASGNAVQVFTRHTGSSNYDKAFASYEHASFTGPQLLVEYTPSS